MASDRAPMMRCASRSRSAVGATTRRYGESQLPSCGHAPLSSTRVANAVSRPDSEFFSTRLRPVPFDWGAGGLVSLDMGLARSTHPLSSRKGGARERLVQWGRTALGAAQSRHSEPRSTDITGSCNRTADYQSAAGRETVSLATCRSILMHQRQIRDTVVARVRRRRWQRTG